ncbi:MAG: carbohydrate porin, partial [Pseudomonas sp.]
AAEPSNPAPAGEAAPPAADSAARARALDAEYGYKGWNIPFPSFADSLTQDDGHWRSRLAAHGFGVSTQHTLVAQANVLDTPGRVPASVPACVPANLGYNCAGGRSYFGQRPAAIVSSLVFLTYDTRRWGVPDGQIALGVQWGVSSDEAYLPRNARVQNLSWYQTLFDGRAEFKIGWFPTLPEFVGFYVGGLVTNPFGPTGSLLPVMGMTGTNWGTPNVRASVHLSDTLYLQAGIQRSLPVNGPTGNPVYDEVRANPSGLDFESSVPGTRWLYTGELGYRRQSVPGRGYTWLRAGTLYNSSTFKDYSRLLEDPTATTRGAHGYYLLGDHQLWQQAPESAYTAYRGVYLGAGYMRGSDRIAPFTDYYELRGYWLGPSARRPQDMLSLVYDRNVVGKPIQALTEAYAPYTSLFANSYANSVTASYMFHLRPGLYATFGLGYTDHPSIQYFQGEGSSLNLLLSVFVTL